MAGAIYRAEFLMIEDKQKDPHTELSDPERGEDNSKKKSVEEIVEKDKNKKRELNISSKAVVASAIALGTFAYNMSVNEQLTSYAIQGDSVASRNLQNQRAINNELISVGGTLLAGAMIGGPIGVLGAGGTLAVKYMIKGIDYNNQVQIYNASVAVDRFIASKEKAKISENVKEFR